MLPVQEWQLAGNYFKGSFLGNSGLGNSKQLSVDRTASKETGTTSPGSNLGPATGYPN